MDFLVDIQLKQYNKFGTKTVTIKENSDGSSSATTEGDRANPNAPNSGNATYTVVAGDTLWGIAQRKLGSGTRRREIYDLNRETIERVARERGLGSSVNGHWIFPGTVLNIPGDRS